MCMSVEYSYCWTVLYKDHNNDADIKTGYASEEITRNFPVMPASLIFEVIDISAKVTFRQLSRLFDKIKVSILH